MSDRLSLSVYADQIIVDCIEKEEGGWVLSNSLHDPDEATFAGLRIEIARKLLAMPALTPIEFANIPRPMIVACYRQEFYDAGRIDSILNMSQNVNLAKAYYSAVVNLGLPNAVTVIQRTVGAKIDGKWGPETTQKFLESVSRTATLTLQREFVKNWIRRYIALVVQNVDAQLAGQTILKRHKNLEGWYERAAKFLP